MVGKQEYQWIRTRHEFMGKFKNSKVEIEGPKTDTNDPDYRKRGKILIADKVGMLDTSMTRYTTAKFNSYLI